jgi:hypothetical protein
MTAFRPTVLERAFSLARTGAYRTVTDIRMALAREGYSDVQSQLSGYAIRNDLRRLMRAAFGERTATGT